MPSDHSLFGFLHRHPRIEKDLHPVLQDDHVVVDIEDWDTARKEHEDIILFKKIIEQMRNRRLFK